MATVQTAMTPSTGPAGQRTPRTPRRSQLAHTTTRSTAPATAGLVQEGARQDADREPLLTDALTEAADQQAGMLEQGTTKVRPDPALRLRTEKETSATASAPSDDALSSSPRRRRRGGRRRRKPSPLPPTTAGGGGGGMTRAARRHRPRLRTSTQWSALPRRRQARGCSVFRRGRCLQLTRRCWNTTRTWFGLPPVRYRGEG